MRGFLFLLLLTCGLACLAQDTEYNDYRRKTENWSRIYDKSLRSDLASFTIAGLEESLDLTPLKRIPAVQFGSDYIIFDSANIRVTIKSAIFVPGKRKMTYEAKHLVKIDNKPYYGNYGRLPGTVIAGVYVVIDKDSVPIPASAFSDLYNPSLTYRDQHGNVASQAAVYLSKDKRKIYVYMLNKDDTGSYEVTWIIQDKKYLRRVLDFGFTQ